MKRTALALTLCLTSFAIWGQDETVSQGVDLSTLKAQILENPKEVNLRIKLIEYYFDHDEIQEALTELNKLKQSGAALPLWGLMAAKLYIATQHFDEAITVLEELGEQSQDPEKWILLGDAFVAQGKLKEAKQSYQKVTQEYLQKDIALSRLAVIENNVEVAQQKIDSAKAKLKQHPNTKEDSKVHTLQAELYRKQKNWDKALLNYQEAIALDSKNIVAKLQYTSLLWGLKDKNRFEEAAVDLYQQLPNHQRSMYYIAIVYLEQGKTSEALKVLNNAALKFPNFPQSFLLLSRVYFDQGKYLLAEQNVKTFLNLSPNHALGTKLYGAINLKIGRAAEAIKILQPLAKSHEEDPNFLALYGTALLLNHENEKAQQYLEKARALGMKHPSIETELAISLLQQGEKSEGHALLEKIVTEDDSNIQADVLLAISLVDSNEYSKALQVAQAIVDKKPDLPAAYNLMGMIYEKSKQLENAKEYYQQALKKDPNFVLAQNNLSELYILQNNFSDAERNLRLTLKKQPTELRAQLLMAFLKEKLGQPKEAVSWFEKAKIAHPDSIAPRMQYIEYFLRKGDFKQANYEADRLYQQYPRSKAVLALVGKLKTLQKKYKEAFDIYENWLTLDNDNPFVRYMLARSALQLGENEMAENNIDQLLSQYGKYVPALLFKAEMLIRDKKVDDALQYAQRALAIVPQSDYVHKLLGQIYLLKQNKQKSLEQFQAAYQINPNMTNVINLSQSLSQNDQKEKGFALLEQWANARPNHMGIKRYLAAECLAQGQDEKAIQYYEEIAKTTQKDVVTYNNLAALYISRDLNKALEYAQTAYHLAPQEPSVADTLGWILVKKDSPEKGLPLLEQAFSKAPNELDIGYHLALAHYKLGSKGQALKILEAHKAHWSKQSDHDAIALLETLKNEMSVQ